MDSLVVLLTLFALSFFSALSFSDEPPTHSFSEITQLYNIKDFSKPHIFSETIHGGCDDFYYVNIGFPGFFRGEPFEIQLTMQTLSLKKMKNISRIIKRNYPRYGLPQCIVNDLYADEWSADMMKKELFRPPTFKSAPDTCFGKFLHLPWTSCINVERLYPED